MTQLKQCAEALREKFFIEHGDGCREATTEEIEAVLKPYFDKPKLDLSKLPEATYGDGIPEEE